MSKILVATTTDVLADLRLPPALATSPALYVLAKHKEGFMTENVKRRQTSLAGGNGRWNTISRGRDARGRRFPQETSTW